MPQCRISTMGQERRVVDFTEGESLGDVFRRIGVDVPTGAGVEIWVNGEKKDSWSSYRLAENDAIVLMPNVKGATNLHFVARQVVTL